MLFLDCVNELALVRAARWKLLQDETVALGDEELSEPNVPDTEYMPPLDRYVNRLYLLIRHIGRATPLQRTPEWLEHWIHEVFRTVCLLQR